MILLLLTCWTFLLSPKPGTLKKIVALSLKQPALITGIYISPVYLDGVSDHKAILFNMVSSF